jgi:hypothetical protein
VAANEAEKFKLDTKPSGTVVGTPGKSGCGPSKALHAVEVPGGLVQATVGELEVCHDGRRANMQGLRSVSTVSRLQIRGFASVLFCLTCGLLSATVSAQDPVAKDEIPIERCDRLPVVKVHVAGKDMHLLVDTAATSLLNLKSFAGGRSKEVHITSWAGTAATNASEVSLPEFTLGKHTLRDLKLPAIDLSPIGAACGQVDLNLHAMGSAS